MCMLALSSAIKGKIISHYPDSGDTMYRLLFNQAIFPRIQNSQQKAFNLLFCRCEPLGNFRKFEKFQANHFLPLLQSRRRKVNTNSKTSATKMRMQFLKMDCFVSKVPSKQSKLQFQLVKSQGAVLNQLTYLFLQHLLVNLKIKMLQILSLKIMLVLHVKLH